MEKTHFRVFVQKWKEPISEQCGWHSATADTMIDYIEDIFYSSILYIYANFYININQEEKNIRTT